MTDAETDIYMMGLYTGYNNSYFYPIWTQFASGALWDGESCSEIACCISYLGGNLSKIFVSNYAQGLSSQFQAAGRFGSTPTPGAFIWFDYDGDGVPDHTGRVMSVSGNNVHTFEGNVGGLTVQRDYDVNTSYIYGYGYPYYTDQPVPDPPTPPTPTPGGKHYLPYYRHMRRLRGE